MKNDFENVLNKTPIELFYWLNENFRAEPPEVIVSAEDMTKASDLMLKITGYYSYLMSLFTYAKLKAREYKREKSKEEYEDMIDRRDMLEKFTDVLKQTYSATSRAVTIHIENNNELKMSHF